MPQQTIETYDGNGNLVGTRQVEIPAEVANDATIRQQIALAIQTFENADANWATLTAAQRNDVLKLAVRSLARVGRILNNQLDAT